MRARIAARTSGLAVTGPADGPRSGVRPGTVDHAGAGARATAAVVVAGSREVATAAVAAEVSREVATAAMSRGRAGASIAAGAPAKEGRSAAMTGAGRGAKAGSVAASTGVGGGPGGMRGGSRAALARAAAQETATIGLREAATGRVPVTTGHVASVATVTVSAT